MERCRGNYAFMSCRNLTSITLPESVLTIGKDTFYSCDKLNTITFRDTTTWYATTSETDWKNKTGGTEIDVTSSLNNATYFKSTYCNYYLYKNNNGASAAPYNKTVRC